MSRKFINPLWQGNMCMNINSDVFMCSFSCVYLHLWFIHFYSVFHVLITRWGWDKMAIISRHFQMDFHINNILALVQIMAWCRPRDKPIPEALMVSSLTHIYVTQPQWVNTMCSLISQNLVSHIEWCHPIVWYEIIENWRERGKKWWCHQHWACWWPAVFRLPLSGAK